MGKKIIDEIINYIERNRVSSVEVADALDKTGVLEGIKIFNPGHFVVGKINYFYADAESNWSLHKQIQNVEEDSLAYIDAINCKERAVFGDLVSKYLVLYKKVKGIIVNGYLRDAHRLRKENYPIWCKGVTPLGCFNNKVNTGQEIKEYINNKAKLFNGSIMVCDDSGCTLIEKRLLKKELIKKLDFIELQEDIWYFCTDTLKLSTYEAVCLKKYLSDDTLLPRNLKRKLLKIKKRL